MNNSVRNIYVCLLYRRKYRMQKVDVIDQMDSIVHESVEDLGRIRIIRLLWPKPWWEYDWA